MLSVQDYFDQLLASREGCRLKVRQDGEFGKGKTGLLLDKLGFLFLFSFLIEFHTPGIVLLPG